MLLLVALGSGAAVPCPLFAEEVLPDTTSAVRFLVAGMKKERAKWKSAEGSFTAQWRVPNLPVDSSARGYVAFDGGLDRGRLRWDWEGPGSVIRPESARSAAATVTASTQWGRVAWYFAVNESHSARYRSDERVISVFPTRNLGWQPLASYAVEPVPEDLWGFCLYGTSGRFKEFDAVVDQMVTCSRYDSARVVKQADGTWRFEFYGDNLTRDTFTYIIDVNRGFTPLTYRYVQQRSEKTLQAIEELWQKRDTLSRQEQEKLARIRRHGAGPVIVREKFTSWTQIDDVWVPVKHHIRRSTPEESPEETGYTFHFAWEAINQEVAPRVFSYEGFPVDEQVPVYDYGQKTFLRGSLPPSSAPLARGSAILWIALGVALIVVSATIWGLRFRVRRTH